MDIHIWRRYYESSSIFTIIHVTAQYKAFITFTHFKYKLKITNIYEKKTNYEQIQI